MRDQLVDRSQLYLSKQRVNDERNKRTGEMMDVLIGSTFNDTINNILILLIRY